MTVPLDAEVQALKAEIDRVATTTTFNSQNLLDGSYKATFQIGDKGGQTVGLKIGSVLTSSLGMGEGASGANSLVSRRVAFATVEAGDIQINGMALGAIASTDHMEDVVKNINDNVDNVKASAFNVVVAENVGNGVTGGDGINDGTGTVETGMVIKVREQGVTADTTFTISASSNMDELVANINNETGGVVSANVNEDGKLVLSNTTGAAITVEDDSTSGSGFSSTAATFNGFLKLEGLDDEPIRVTRGNKGLASPGTDADLTAIGFRETKASTLNDGYTVMSTSLTEAGAKAALNQGELFINGVEIYDADITVNSLTDKLSLINSKSAETGVTASAFFERTFTIDTAKLTIGDKYEINGHDITLSAATVADLVTQLNSVTDKTGIKAVADGNNITLSGENIQTVTIGRKTEAEIEAAFNAATTTEIAAGATTVADVSIVLNAADVVVGRTYELKTTGTTSTLTFDVNYTAESGDTKLEVMQGLRDALIAASETKFLGAASTTVDVTTTSGTLKLDANLGFGKNAFEFGIESTSINDAFGIGSNNYDGQAFHARLKLDSVNNQPIKIDLGQNHSAASHGLLESGVGAADFDVNEPTLSAAGGTSMSGLTVADASSATKALGTIDNAIDTVNSIRGDLGALQNRLEYTINNLSSISNATSGARGRILDADFAKTTSELTKHQILTQAATSMLAQANQSKQGILALLQG